jgi:hypothetical protein
MGVATLGTEPSLCGVASQKLLLVVNSPKLFILSTKTILSLSWISKMQMTHLSTNYGYMELYICSVNREYFRGRGLLWYYCPPCTDLICHFSWKEHNSKYPYKHIPCSVIPSNVSSEHPVVNVVFASSSRIPSLTEASTSILTAAAKLDNI